MANMNMERLTGLFGNMSMNMNRSMDMFNDMDLMKLMEFVSEMDLEGMVDWISDSMIGWLQSMGIQADTVVAIDELFEMVKGFMRDFIGPMMGNGKANICKAFKEADEILEGLEIWSNMGGRDRFMDIFDNLMKNAGLRKMFRMLQSMEREKDTENMMDLMMNNLIRSLNDTAEGPISDLLEMLKDDSEAMSVIENIKEYTDFMG